MRRDHRPYALKKADQRIQRFYTRRILAPQLDGLGKGCTVIKPWYVEAFGPRIAVGDYATLIAAPDRRVRFSVWPRDEGEGEIRIGNYCLICPGVRIGSAASVTIADNAMIASSTYITDSDWHEIYNRAAMDRGKPVRILENAWIGDSAIICKGVTVGENSIVGAGSVVRRDVPDNVVAAGNPASVVKKIDPEAEMTKRSDWFADPDWLWEQFDLLDRENLRGNTWWGWARRWVGLGKPS